MAEKHSFTEYVADRFYNDLWSAIEGIIQNDADGLDLRLRNVSTIDTAELTDITVKHVWTESLSGMEIAFEILC